MTSKRAPSEACRSVLDQIADALAVFEGSLLTSAEPVVTSLQTFLLPPPP
jgi:hypothetical protein